VICKTNYHKNIGFPSKHDHLTVHIKFLRVWQKGQIKKFEVKIQIINGVNFMYNEKKKVLFLTGMERHLGCFIKKKTNIDPENIIILQSYRPVISQPFGDLMRDIIVAVYQENVEEIVVVATKDDQKNTGDILNKIGNNKELQEKILTLDYLFENCKPEFPEGNIGKWLEGGNTSADDVRNSVHVIRNHPLMPSNVKVTELWIDYENEKRSII
jgi:carbonic anhydrase